MGIQLEKLRCTHCGAPLPQPREGENFIKCDYCGYLNKVVDSTAYVERLKNEITKWLSQILPQQIIVSTTIDPVARHHIFQGYIKPNVIIAGTNAKTIFLKNIHRSILVYNPVHVYECDDSKSLFEKSILIDGVADLAIADEDRVLIDETRRNLLVSAYICNAVRDAIEEKYLESVKNIDEAIKLIESSDDKALLTRLRIARTTYTSLIELYNKNPESALSLIKESEKLVHELLEQRNNSTASKYLPAIQVESDLVRLIKNLAEMSKIYFENGLDPVTPQILAKRVLKYVNDNIKSYNRPLKDSVETVELIKKTILSRLGRERARVLGSGDLYIPFYVISANITYTSGLLFKKGQETRVKLLVSATPPVFTSITDVFSLYSGRTISIGEEEPAVKSVSNALVQIREDYLKGKAVVPLISYAIADIIAEKYIDTARSKYIGKIKLSTTRVEEIIFLGVQVINGAITGAPVSLTIFNSDLNKLSEIMV